ncbi:MAG TPA: glycosyltransferase family A protein [Chthoniobacterales bacterium]
MGEDVTSESAKGQAGQPLVSVVVPAFNAEDLIKETLESVSAQHYSNLEIIIVDDGSSDGTCAVVEDWAKRDPRVRLIRQPNAGVGAARNTGIAAAKGKYIAPVDADDIWHPDKTLAQVTVMEKWGDSAGFAYCWTRLINEASEFKTLQPTCSVEGDVFYPLFFRNFTHNASSPMFRASALREVGGYATREEQGGVQGCEDWELCLRVAERYKVCVAPRYLIDYRVAGSGMSFNVNGMEKSFHWMIRATTRRQPQISKKLVRWTTGHLYLYLALKARVGGQTPTTLRCLKNAMQNDPAVLLAPRFVGTLAQSIYRTIRPWKNVPSGPGGVATEQPLQPAKPNHTWRHVFNRRLMWMLYMHVENSRFTSLVKGQTP